MMTPVKHLIPPLYQVDFTATGSGKHIAPTKRQIRFMFGIADAAALNAGDTGVHCRGEEHTVDFIWSLTSGKRVLLVDNKVIHCSMVNPHSHLGLVDSKFEYDFALPNIRFSRGGERAPRHGKRLESNFCKIVAHPFTPAGWDGITPPGRQFDLFVNGQSYFDFVKIYQLGRTRPTSQQHYLTSYNDTTTATAASRGEFVPRPSSTRSTQPQYHHPSTSDTSPPHRPSSAPPLEHVTIPSSNNSLYSTNFPNRGSFDEDDESIFAFGRPLNDDLESVVFPAPPTWEDYRQAYGTSVAPASLMRSTSQQSSAQRSRTQSSTTQPSQQTPQQQHHHSQQQQRYQEENQHVIQNINFQTVHSAFCPIPERGEDEKKQQEDGNLIDLDFPPQVFQPPQTQPQQPQFHQQPYSQPSPYTTNWNPSSYASAPTYSNAMRPPTTTQQQPQYQPQPSPQPRTPSSQWQTHPQYQYNNSPPIPQQPQQQSQQQYMPPFSNQSYYRTTSSSF